MQTDQFPALLREHQHMVFSIALRIAADRGAAEEIAQDVFLELHKTLAELSTPEHVLYWLRRVATHRSIDHVRRLKQNHEVGVDEATLEGLMDTAAQNQQGDTVIDERLQILLGSLPALQRGVLMLRYQEDMTPDEIAATLAMPVATVKSHLQRTLALLRTKAERMMR